MAENKEEKKQKKSGVEQLACNFDKPFVFCNLFAKLCLKAIWGMIRAIFNVFFAKK